MKTFVNFLNIFFYISYRHTSYLSPIGSKAVLKSRSQTVTRDELFSLEDSLPQSSFIAALNSKYVSVKQGVDVTANQDEIGENETFQLEFDWSAHRWALRTTQVSVGSWQTESCEMISIFIYRTVIGVCRLAAEFKRLAIGAVPTLCSSSSGTVMVPCRSVLTMVNFWPPNDQVTCLPPPSPLKM